MARHHRHHRHHEDDDERDTEDNWDRTDKRQRRHFRLAAYLPYIVLILMILGIIFTAVYFIFNPPSDSALRQRRVEENASSFTDRATAFKVLELMEARRNPEAIALAESIAEKIPNTDRDFIQQIRQRPEEARRRLDQFICAWIKIEHAAATQTTMAKRAGYPGASTPDTAVLFLCDYADYLARNFITLPREINEEIFSRIFLQAADEKLRRAAPRGEQPR